MLTLGSKTPNLAQGDVLIENDRIADVGVGLRARDAEQVDAREAIVMPGFVDSHRHVWKSLFKNLGDALPDRSKARLAGHFGPDDLYAATLVGLLGAAEAGITTVVDWSELAVETSFADAALQAHLDSGLRTVFVHAGGNGDWESQLRRISQTGPDSTTVASGHADATRSGVDRVPEAWEQARRLGLRIHAHAGVEPADQGLLANLFARGLLGEDVTLIHCTNLADTDLDAVSASGSCVSLTPSSEMAGGLGPPPVQRLIDRGIRPGLGVDDEWMGPGDILAQMRAVISLQHATYFDLRLAGKAGLPNLLTTREVIRYATSGSARTAGVGEVTGSLEPGKKADIIVLRTDRPNIHPINDPIGAVVWGMDTSNLDWVFVGGRAVMSDGVLQADVDRVRELAITAQRRILDAADVTAEMSRGGTA